MNQWLTNFVSKHPVVSVLVTLLTGAGSGQVLEKVNIPDLSDTHTHDVSFQQCTDYSDQIDDLTKSINEVLGRAIIPREG